MKIQLLSTLKKYKKDYLKQDIFSGIIIAAVSIPISMGYAQIAGLPPAYGFFVWFYSSYIIIRNFFYIKTIYFWCRCCSRCSCRQCAAFSWYCSRIWSCVELYTDFGTFYWSVASFLLHYKSILMMIKMHVLLVYPLRYFFLINNLENTLFLCQGHGSIQSPWLYVVIDLYYI